MSPGETYRRADQKPQLVNARAPTEEAKKGLTPEQVTWCDKFVNTFGQLKRGWDVIMEWLIEEGRQKV